MFSFSGLSLLFLSAFKLRAFSLGLRGSPSFQNRNLVEFFLTRHFNHR